MHDHILSQFDIQLNHLRELIIRMTSITRNNITNAIRGLIDRDTNLCNATIAADQDVNDLEKKVDQLAMEILIKYQPAAHDFRQVVGIQRVSNDLERISDQASSIAKKARLLNEQVEFKELKLIQPVYEMCLAHYDQTIQAFIKGEADYALTIRKSDKELDLIEKDLQARLIVMMEEKHLRVDSAMQLVFIGRYLERIGDHCKNICEDTIFIEKAKDIRHEKNKRLEIQS
jgi:phosphate transport system protein